MIHATVVAAATAQGWRAALLRGPSGSGKSDLALRLIAGGWRLVGDDYVEVWRSGSALYATGADRLVGLIEARGVGLAQASVVRVARIGLIVDCIPDPERLPEARVESLEGVEIPRLILAALEPSAPAKLRVALLGRDMASRLEP